jgi:membrane protein implicated in regulation of membrane protease activity
VADWLVWLVAAGVLAAAEVATLTLVLGMLAGACLVAAATAAVGFGVPMQVLVFAAVAIALLLLVRPVARRHRTVPHEVRTGTAALVGRRAVALTDVDRSGGQVRLSGEVWTARSYDESLVIPAGAAVDVASIDGATAVVLPVELP